MKTVFYTIGILTFSAIMLSPRQPKDYPPKDILEQRKYIVHKEHKIESLINQIESRIKQDSTQIKTHAK